LPAAAGKKLQKTKSLLEKMQQHHPTTEKPRISENNDVRVRHSRCCGINFIVVNDVERQLKGDVVCACGYDPELPQHCEDELEAAAAAAASCPNDDQLTCVYTSTLY